MLVAKRGNPLRRGQRRHPQALERVFCRLYQQQTMELALGGGYLCKNQEGKEREGPEDCPLQGAKVEISIDEGVTDF